MCDTLTTITPQQECLRGRKGILQDLKGMGVEIYVGHEMHF